MKPRRFPTANVVYELLGGNEDNSLWCERVAGGSIYSEWQPTDEERRIIAEGGRVWLRIFGEPIPPVALGAVRYDGDAPFYPDPDAPVERDDVPTR